jgi:hypothetical protein
MADDLRSKTVTVPAHALVRMLPDDEAVVMNLDTEVYHGLNATAARMWNALAAGGTVGAAFDQLDSELEVESDILWADLESLVNDLVGRGLLELSD